MFTLPAANVAASFTAPLSVGSGLIPSNLPSLPGTGFSVSGVLDDAKAKAQELEGKAKQQFNKAETAVKNQVPQSAGGNKIELYSGKYYAVSALGGALACGLTHAFVTPLDLVKCRRQVDKTIYSGNMDGWKKIGAQDGIRGLYTGWTPTLLGYSLQGSCKYGFYEFFKKKYSDLAGPENAIKYKDAIYLVGSASAEVIADVALVPMETVKVRIQTTIPPFARGISDGYSKIVAAEGAGALFKSLPSLWSRQIPYTMMKFWSFEATVAQIYKQLGKPKASYNKLQQLGVSFAGGYLAGIFCAIVSHPADVMVSKLNAPVKAGEAKPTVGQIYSQIGFGGLWSGLGIRIVMIGTLTGLQWLIYDSFKVQMGLPTTGSAAPAPDAGAIKSQLH